MMKEQKLEELKETFPRAHQTIMDNDGECWTTDEVTTAFEITGFMAPFCTAIKRSTGEKGTLTFVHQPRLYYAWRIS